MSRIQQRYCKIISFFASNLSIYVQFCSLYKAYSRLNLCIYVMFGVWQDGSWGVGKARLWRRSDGICTFSQLLKCKYIYCQQYNQIYAIDCVLLCIACIYYCSKYYDLKLPSINSCYKWNWYTQLLRLIIISPDKARKRVIYPLKMTIYAQVGIFERTFTR